MFMSAQDSNIFWFENKYRNLYAMKGTMKVWCVQIIGVWRSHAHMWCTRVMHTHTSLELTSNYRSGMSFYGTFSSHRCVFSVFPLVSTVLPPLLPSPWSIRLLSCCPGHQDESSGPASLCWDVAVADVHLAASSFPFTCRNAQSVPDMVCWVTLTLPFMDAVSPLYWAGVNIRKQCWLYYFTSFVMSTCWINTWSSTSSASWISLCHAVKQSTHKLCSTCVHLECV